MQLHDACSCVVKIYTTTTCKQALAGSTTSLYLSPCEKFNLVQCKLCVINTEYGATAHLGTVHTVRGVGAKLAATATAVSSIVITLLRDLRRLSSVSLLLETASPPVNEL